MTRKGRLVGVMVTMKGSDTARTLQRGNNLQRDAIARVTYLRPAGSFYATILAQI